MAKDLLPSLPKLIWSCAQQQWHSALLHPLHHARDRFMLSAIIYYWPLYVLVLSVCYINVEEEIRKELTGSVAIAVQKGNAKILLAEYHRAVSGAARCGKGVA